MSGIKERDELLFRDPVRAVMEKLEALPTPQPQLDANGFSAYDSFAPIIVRSFTVVNKHNADLEHD